MPALVLSPATFAIGGRTDRPACEDTRSSDASRCWRLLFGAALPGLARPGETVSLPPDSPRWELEGQAKPAEYLGRRCLSLDGGGATVKDFEMRDGVVDVDVATPARRGFFGIQFRIAADGGDAEWVYLRQHKSGLPDAIQYTPVLHTGAQLADLQRAGVHGRGRHPEGRVVPPAARGRGRAGEALRQGHGEAGARDGRPEERRPEGPGRPRGPDRRDLLLELRDPHDARRAVGAPSAADAAGHAHAAGASRPPTTRSSADLEQPLSKAESAAIAWQDVEAEPPGFVVLYRYREAPHLRVVVRERLLEAPRAAAGDESPLRAHDHRVRPRRGPAARRSATATKCACS